MSRVRLLARPLVVVVAALLLAACPVVKTYKVKRGDLIYYVEIIKNSDGTISRVTRFIPGKPGERLPPNSNEIKDYIQPEDKVLDTDTEQAPFGPLAQAAAVDQTSLFALGGGTRKPPPESYNWILPAGTLCEGPR